MKSRFCMATAAGVLLLVGACDLFTGPDGRVIGVIGVEGYGEMAPSMLGSVAVEECLMTWFECGGIVLFAPDTVTAGEAFEIVVRTVSQTRKCWLEDGADVTASAMSIEVVPYDIELGDYCPDAGPRMLPRILELVFPEPGDAMLRLTGRVLIAGDSTRSERFHSIDRPVVVR